ncbi:MAG: M23 family metallopeptidase [gamma proteobacterium endosymbiont of Lamellibrachia anaximandri]|nr:M23 family metallopeptidase [gamma proteobacterium endosymbiont of Lamellibrachia anaximandri]MBL3619247.1 M23 family metallopeptidase [gamma proteobacterium endosymbiont of Lamellibrachia anaximandri]
MGIHNSGVLPFLHALMFLLFAGTVSATSKTLILEGNLVQGGMAIGHVSPGEKVSVNGIGVRVSADGVFVLGFGRDAALENRVDVTGSDGRKRTKLVKIGKRTYKIQRIDGLPQKKVTPPKMDWARIKKENAMVKQARKLDDPRTDFLGGFVWPVKGRISGVYGSQRVLNGTPKRPHMGVDVAASTGTKVVAPADGVVTLVHNDMFYSGGTLLVDHGHGLTSSFLHLSRILVKKGSKVQQGDIIAEVGSTGRATGPHLHWGLNLFGTRLDPQLVAGAMAKK